MQEWEATHLGEALPTVTSMIGGNAHSKVTKCFPNSYLVADGKSWVPFFTVPPSPSDTKRLRPLQVYSKAIHVHGNTAIIVYLFIIHLMHPICRPESDECMHANNLSWVVSLSLFSRLKLTITSTTISGLPSEQCPSFPTSLKVMKVSRICISSKYYIR